jgi:hypothetical protein
VRGRLLLPGVAAAAAALVACSSPEVPDVDTGLPSTGVSLPPPSAGTRPLPAATHKWKTTGLVCPELTGPSAAALGLSGTGKVTDSTDVAAAGNSIDCRWGPGGGRATTVTLHLDTATSQAAADAYWRILSAALPVPLDGAGEQAFMSADTGSDEIQIAVRSGNANLDIRLTAGEDDTKRANAMRDAAATIASDMLGTLAPA